MFLFANLVPKLDRRFSVINSLYSGNTFRKLQNDDKTVFDLPHNNSIFEERGDKDFIR